MIRRSSQRAGPAPSGLALAIAIGCGGLLLLAQLVVLTLSLGEISSTRDHVAATDAKAERALALTQPLADEAAPALDRALSLARLARPALRDGAELLAPLSDRAGDLSLLIDRFPVLESGLRRLIGRIVPIAERINVDRLGSAGAAVAEFATELTEGGRLSSVIDRVDSLLASIRDRGLLDRAVRSARTLKAVLRVQRLAFRTQQRALSVQRRSLRRLRRIDERLGGGVLGRWTRSSSSPRTIRGADP